MSLICQFWHNVCGYLINDRLGDIIIVRWTDEPKVKTFTKTLTISLTPQLGTMKDYNVSLHKFEDYNAGYPGMGKCNHYLTQPFINTTSHTTISTVIICKNYEWKWSAANYNLDIA